MLQLKLLGGFEARQASGGVIDIAARKTRALLAYLALPAGRAHSRDKLVGLLWSDRGDKQARDSLRQALSELGRALGAIDPPPLIKDHDTIALDAGAVEVDAVAFERLAASGDAADLRRAAAFYVGDLLDGIGVRDAAFEDWLLVERQRLRRIAAAALKKLLPHETGAGAIGIAQRLLALDPSQEEGHRALMRLHAEAGDVAAALRQYETCREILKSDLDVAPSGETEALQRQIRSRVAASPPLAAPDRGGPPPAPTRSSKPSVAVLPFRGLSDDPAQRYFSDGITEDIITELARFRELFVIARHSSFQYRGEAVDVKHIGHDLGVDYIVEGSVRRDGARLRVAAQLVEASTGHHLWAERYDRHLADILAVQDDVVRTIAATLAGRVVASGADRARRKPTQDWAAYDFLLQGRERLQQYDADGAESLLKRAIELDPGFAEAHAWQAVAYVTKFFFSGRAEILIEAEAYARKALSLDISDAWCHFAMGAVHTFMNRLESAGAYFEKATALNPTDVQIAYWRAMWLSRMGRTGEALAYLDSVVQRDPFMPDWFWEARSIPLLQERRYEEVIQSVNRIDRKQAWNHGALAAAYAHLGRIDEAKVQAAEVLRLKPDYSERWVRVQEPYKDPAHLEHLLDGLRKAGLPSD
jgi:TolB-like protein